MTNFGKILNVGKKAEVNLQRATLITNFQYFITVLKFASLHPKCNFITFNVENL